MSLLLRNGTYITLEICDNYVFEDDPLLTQEKIRSFSNRGGSGVIRLKREKGIWTANRDIILGLNIPNYPHDN